MNPDGRALILFARLPRVGQVKTRLMPKFSPEDACALHEALLTDSLDLLRRCGDKTGAECHLYLSEAGALGDDIASHLGNATLKVQRGKDLGERLLNAFQECLEEGHRRIVALGSDSPHLPDAYVARAFEELERADIVVGPARDGGYYLLGASRLHASLLTGMPWGTAQLYRETIRKARKEGIPIASLPAWYDVDTPESVGQFWKDLSIRHTQGDATTPKACFALLGSWSREGKLF